MKTRYISIPYGREVFHNLPIISAVYYMISLLSPWVTFIQHQHSHHTACSAIIHSWSKPEGVGVRIAKLKGVDRNNAFLTILGREDVLVRNAQSWGALTFLLSSSLLGENMCSSFLCVHQCRHGKGEHSSLCMSEYMNTIVSASSMDWYER